LTLVYERVMRGCYAVASGVALALVVVIIAGIVSRQVFHPLIWSNEVAITLFVWLIFLGAGVAAAENAHIRVMLVADAVPESLRRVLLLAVSYVGAAILIAVLLDSIKVTYGFRGDRFTTLDISAAWSWSAIPAGTAMMLAGWIRHGCWTWQQAGKRPEHPSEVVV